MIRLELELHDEEDLLELLNMLMTLERFMGDEE